MDWIDSCVAYNKCCTTRNAHNTALCWGSCMMCTCAFHLPMLAINIRPVYYVFRCSEMWDELWHHKNGIMHKCVETIKDLANSLSIWDLVFFFLFGFLLIFRVARKQSYTDTSISKAKMCWFSICLKSIKQHFTLIFDKYVHYVLLRAILAMLCSILCLMHGVCGKCVCVCMGTQ